MTQHLDVFFDKASAQDKAQEAETMAGTDEK